MYSSPNPQDSSKLLTKTSFLFIVSGVYAYQYHLYWYSLVLLLNTILSVNFWRNPVYGFRRNLDIYFAKFSFCVFFINGVYYTKFLNTLYNLLVLQLICFYIVAQYLSDIKKDYTWYRYHAIFHVYCLICQLIVLHSINDNTQLKLM